MRAIRRFTVRTALPQPISALSALATNLRWSWHAPTRALFESIDPDAFARVGEDPLRLLAEVSPECFEQCARDETFVAAVNAAHDDLTEYLNEDRWFQRECAGELDAVAYFSPEYGITHVLPQYSGGLGILAGDHLKSASDLGVPLIGVGLLYESGYFKQALTRDGWQTETYPVCDPNELPLSRLRLADGTPATVTLALPGGRELAAYVWKADVGRVPLLLLDSSVPTNDDDLRTITDRLYGGEGEHRMSQEMLLGIGGVRAVRLYCELTGHPAPHVFHTNEGHAGFLGLERMRELREQGLTFDEAREAVRAGTVFTTHTPVPAGIDRFDRDMVRRYLGDSGVLGALDIEQILPLGAETFEGGDPAMFNMAVMGLRLAQRANGVSQLHGHVSRGMFGGLWDGFDADEVPITSITNGVHAPTWVDPKMVALAEEHLGAGEVARGVAWDTMSEVPVDRLWALRRELRAELVEYAREKTRWSWTKRGASAVEMGWIDTILDPDVLTIGFARRVPTYKRLTLMLRDPERLRALLLHPERPIQLVIAGKSHPADEQGKRLIQQMVQFADDPELRHRIVFLPNYDIHMAQHLYPGCDVWLNNPLRPFEACGTSGMKSALNGGLNLSILDGWWDEWFDGENGWAIPTADTVEDTDRRDELEAAALYSLIENEVAPRFYDRDTDGIPQRWMAMMTHTLATLGTKVLAARMVRDYTRTLYLPAAHAARSAAADNYAVARDLAAYRLHLAEHFDGVHVDHVEATGISDEPQLGDRISVNAHVSLGELSPDEVAVQVVYGRASEADVIVADKATCTMEHAESYEDGRHRFTGQITLNRTGSFGYSVRVLPHHLGLASHAELGRVRNA